MVQLSYADYDGKKFTAIATGVESDIGILFIISFDTLIHFSDVKKTALHLISLFF